MLLTCLKIEEEQFLNYDFSCIKIKNLRIVNSPTQQEKVFAGQSYLIASFAPYGHSLLDYYGQFLVLKNQYPDLVPIFYEDKSRGLFRNNKIADDLDYMLQGPISIIDISKDNLFFNELVMFFDMSNPFPEKFFIDNKLTRSSHYFPFCSCYMGTEKCGQSSYFKYNYLAINELRNNFLHFFSNTKNKKLFVSRKKYNDSYYKEIQKYSKKNYLSEDEKQLYFRATIRYSHHEGVAQEVFEGLGYEVVCAEDYTLIEQIKLFSSASEIASISGTCLFNSIWCNRDTTAFEIESVENFRYHYKEFSEHVGVNHKKINIKGLSNLEAKEILLQNLL